MKTKIQNSQTKRILLGIMAAMMVLSMYSCAKKTVAAAKTESPAVVVVAPDESGPLVLPPENKGQVEIKRDINSNYVIQINLRGLDAVNKLDPDSKNAFVVWMNADNQKAKNLGQINSNTGWLTDKSKASFEATSPFKPTKIYITEEANATVKVPGKNILWSTPVFK